MADTAALYEQLLHDYGGPARLSTVEISVCKSLAIALAADAPDGKIIASLTTLLPQKSSAADTPYNFAFLDGDEFALLDALSKKATGEKVALPVNALLMSTRRDFTIREQQALELAQLLDGVDKRRPEHWINGEPTPDEVHEATNLISMILSLTMTSIAVTSGAAPAAAPARTEKPVGDVPIETAAPSTEPPPLPLAVQGNVVSMPSRLPSIHDGEHSLARPDISQPLGGGVSNERKSFSRFDNNGPLP